MVTIKKILNNNVVLVEDQGSEKIVMGRGLAFQKKVGDQLSSGIDKVYTLENSQDLPDLMLDIPIEVVEAVGQFITFYEHAKGEAMPERTKIGLFDHLYGAIKRAQAGIALHNLMLRDIRRFYVKEYEFGLQAIDILNDRLAITLSHDEAANVALYLATINSDVDQVAKVTQLIGEIIDITRRTLQIELDESSVYYDRFLTHLKFFAQRLLGGYDGLEEHRDEDLLALIKQKYQGAYLVADRIRQFIAQKYQSEVSLEEQIYLTIHIQKLIK